MKVVSFFVLVFLFYSCEQSGNRTDKVLSSINKQEIREVKEKRVLYFFTSLDKKRTENYNLSIKSKGKYTVYFYENLDDRRKNIILRFNKKEKTLNFGPQFFTKKEEEFLVKETKNKFNFYWQEANGSDQTRPILFNEKYGFLGIYNSYGPDLVFLKEKTKKSDLLKSILISMENFNPN
ncbi:MULTISPECIES: hypothetical protein [unclassified Tenacibaculum]|uniref:hypothetical protein n=1 Tax=unclassified Tenacibaculum TaxID=2635139 RepID=UPI001F24B0CD|nr:MULTISPECIES: hypothetical protein [unclassified Tenacibaculum]MCF2873952.1 hypothetical protein [Tenacibaculum sp. Cn5-1]MCF2934533.1 hypothetical protein [Tenacibaculum sp. Cn5-34]MCG7510743.1 hypothetical protein [Tenacibaculum sp. Cn5-46]